MSLLAEQRFRRQFLRADARQLTVVITVAAVAHLVYLRNDVLLLAPGALLAFIVALKLANTIAAVAAVAVLRRTQRPRTHDRAATVGLFGATACVVAVCLTRASAGEYQGPAFGIGGFLVLIYFAPRSILLARVVAALTTTAVMVSLLVDARSGISNAGQVSGMIAFGALNIVGILSARAFEAERRRRFEAEQQLARERDRALALSQTRARFLATMSHEFRTPMNAVIGLSELLAAETGLSREHRDHVHAIGDSARALLMLLNEILDFAKIDADRLLLISAPFSPRTVATAVIDLLRPSARGLALSLEVAPDVPAGVQGDASRLRQVLVNLVANAIKFTERGSVTLSISMVDAATVFRVADTGIGIAPEVVGRLFEPFEQGDMGIERRFGGTGLGLAISQRIVRAMGGELVVESAEVHGSVFSFSLRLPEAVVSPRPERAAFAPPRTASLAILLVEDHPINRRVAIAILSRLGYTADVAEDGPAAIAAAVRRDYDVVLMDLHMPGLGGVATTERILANLAGRRAPRFVAMTASVLDEDRAACRAAGMEEFVAKPIDIQELANALARAARPAVAANSAVVAAATDPLATLRQLEADGEPGLVAGLCRQFVADTAERLVRMRAALATASYAELERECHSLRSSSALLGAATLAELAGKLEDVSRAGAPFDGTAQLEVIAAEAERFVRTLAAELSRASGSSGAPDRAA